MESLPDALLVGEFPYPTGSPASNILQGHSIAIQKAGATVGVVSLLPAGVCDSEPILFRGAKCWTIQSQKNALTFKNAILRRLAIRDERIAWLRARKLAGVKAIFVYPSMVSGSFIFQLRRLCRANNVRLYAYVVEWHSLRHYPAGPVSFQAVDGEFQRRFLNPMLDGTICITEHLKEYYAKRGCNASVLPPLLDLSDPKWSMSPVAEDNHVSPELRLLFSGAARRDRHDVILRAAHYVRSRGISMVVEYLGSTREVIAALPGVGEHLLAKLGNGVLFHDCVPDAEVTRITSSASFGILLREHANWSSCCFPSKVPEFLACRVPVMCNLTGDLEKYLKDGYNAILIDGISFSSVCASFERAARLSAEKLADMKLAARKTAEQFDCSRFASVYQELIFGGRESRRNERQRLRHCGSGVLSSDI
jgi:glycosyltransferase involved in cell wall biosynthesis